MDNNTSIGLPQGSVVIHTFSPSFLQTRVRASDQTTANLPTMTLYEILYLSLKLLSGQLVKRPS